MFLNYSNYINMCEPSYWLTDAFGTCKFEYSRHCNVSASMSCLPFVIHLSEVVAATEQCEFKTVALVFVVFVIAYCFCLCCGIRHCFIAAMLYIIWSIANFLTLPPARHIACLTIGPFLKRVLVGLLHTRKNIKFQPRLVNATLQLWTATWSCNRNKWRALC